MTQAYDPFAIDQNDADRLNQGMNLGGGIELSFDAPVFWWLNGNPANRALAATTPAVYFGGWASNAEDIDAVTAERGIPGGLVQTDIFTRDSKTIQSYTSRALVVAPIGFRQCWTVGADRAATRSLTFTPGGRQHIQVLALMGLQMPDKTYHSWGPVVLSAKGFQAQYLQSALKDWKKALERPRKEFAPNVPAWAFWCALGTFGQAPETRLVGKAGAQSPVTPINLFTPKEITRDTMIRVFVGREGVSEMARLQESAEDWLNAWKTQAGTNGNGHAAAAVEDEYLEPINNGTMEDEIPF
jgi:hypothetical protein